MESQQSECSNSNSTAAQAGRTAAIFEVLLNDEQAAKFLGEMHPKTLQRLARAGQIPAHKIGRFWFFRLSEINAWIDESCTPARTGLDSAHRPCLVN
jgi:excisionase family DNA binding protein